MVIPANDKGFTSDFRVISSLPPQNIDAEESILGAILLDPAAINMVADILPAEAFSLVCHQEIYACCLTLQDEGRPTDLMSVATWLSDNHILNKVGGQNKLAQLVDRTVSSVNIDLYAELVIEKWMRRRLITTSGELASLAYETEKPLSEVFDMSEAKLFSLTQYRQSSSGLPSPASEILPDVWQALENVFEGMDSGLKTGFYDFDAMTGGFQRGELSVIAGRPSMGKTAILINMAQSIMDFHEKPVALFSLEMSKQQIVQRMLLSRAGVGSHQFRTQNISDHEWQRLGEAAGYVGELPLFVEDSPSPTITEIRSKCRRLQAKHGELGMVAIDYLQLMGDNTSLNRVQEIAQITRGLKSLARELNVPVVLLSQLNRGVESRTDKRPKMSDLRESGSVEQDADLILMLYRDEYYNPDTVDRAIAELIVTKHRNGPTGTVKLLFDAEITQFKNLAR